MFVKMTFLVFFFPYEEVVVAAKRKATVFIKVFLVDVNICKLVSACTFKYEK